MELGADDYISKPFAIPELVATIKIQIKKRETIQREALNRKPAQTPHVIEPSELEDGPGPRLDHSALVAEHSMAGLADSRVCISLPRDDCHSPNSGREPNRVCGTVSGTVHDAESLVTHLRMLDRFHPNLGNTAMRHGLVPRGGTSSRLIGGGATSGLGCGAS